MKRSIVFIVDTDYSSNSYKQMAANYVKFFFKSMQPTDCFGLISLAKTSNKDDIVLEPKEKNIYIKKLILQSKIDQESEVYFKGDRARLNRRGRLEKALTKALDWQMTRVEDKQIVINSHKYVDPHKWIVCLLGSDLFPVNRFLEEHETKLKNAANLSISIMGLSSEPLNNHMSDYRKLCQATREGMYVNIVNKEKSDKVAQQFFSTMDVYPSSKLPIMREFFQVL